MWTELRGLEDVCDYGTPPRDGVPVTLEIDDATVTVPSGSSVMFAAAKAGRPIPKLCATDMRGEMAFQLAALLPSARE
jgi:formate dehydrogenase major subunit